MVAGKRDPYKARCERMGAQVKPDPPIRNMKGDPEWECPNCSTKVKEHPRNPDMGFDDWSGKLECPNCKSSMERKEIGDE